MSTIGWRKRQVMELALEADIKFKTDVFCSDFCDGVYEDDLERFAELVRADEREACAKVCADLVPDISRTANDASVWDVATFDCATAIRARRTHD